MFLDDQKFQRQFKEHSSTELLIFFYEYIKLPILNTQYMSELKFDKE